MAVDYGVGGQHDHTVIPWLVMFPEYVLYTSLALVQAVDRQLPASQV